MSKRPPQRWTFVPSPPFRKDLGKLPREARAAVFVSMRRILEADNPAAVQGVMPVRGVPGLYRIHANSERAELRVFFSFLSGAVARDGFTYAGVVTFVDIRRKDGSTYKFD